MFLINLLLFSTLEITQFGFLCLLFIFLFFFLKALLF